MLALLSRMGIASLVIVYVLIMAACDTLLDTDPEAFAKMDCEELSEWIEIVFDEKFVKLYELDQVAKTETRLTCQGFALESGGGGTLV